MKKLKIGCVVELVWVVCPVRSRLGVMEGLNSNLNLNEGAEPRVIPGIGEWSPRGVYTTRRKKRQRWITVFAFTGILIAVALYGYWMYTIFS
ncbi:MAG: hypothetical protein LBI99_05340 [Propionibacteriaceae bacterium]|nr:hypothetical protein [Propionibacteriaceae bacterium]